MGGDLRIRIDKLTLDPNNTTMVVPTNKWEKKFTNKVLSQIRRIHTAMGGFPLPLIDIKWHFIVLEDLIIWFNDCQIGMIRIKYNS
jgi:hypothetical protein